VLIPRQAPATVSGSSGRGGGIPGGSCDLVQLGGGRGSLSEEDDENEESNAKEKAWRGSARGQALTGKAAVEGPRLPSCPHLHGRVDR
jgi:hypothetical protein